MEGNLDSSIIYYLNYQFQLLHVDEATGETNTGLYFENKCMRALKTTNKQNTDQNLWWHICALTNPRIRQNKPS